VGDHETQGGNVLATQLFVWVACLFALAVVCQVYLAGYAALLAPEVWDEHVAWVHFFQWFSVALPIAAHVSVRRIGFSLLNCLPMAIIGLQYMLIHNAIRRGLPGFVGLHAVGGVLLLGVLVFSVQEWRYRFRPRRSHKPGAELTE
jgi:hypothetical protein